MITNIFHLDCMFFVYLGGIIIKSGIGIWNIWVYPSPTSDLFSYFGYCANLLTDISDSVAMILMRMALSWWLCIKTVQAILPFIVLSRAERIWVGIFALPAVGNPENPILRRFVALVSSAAGVIWLFNGLMGYWMHISGAASGSFIKW